MLMDKEVDSLMILAIMRHGGLSDFDYEPVAEEVAAIRRTLKRHGYVIKKETKDA